MEPGGNSRAAGVVALVLAFHRAPVKHPDLLHARAPLPAGIDVLLRLAGGGKPEPEHAALASPDEIRAAALFFVERVLLHHDASHYRVLGLEPGATAEQVKEHHRLLMRLFHPDRERHDDDWKDAFATRINLAYTTLHDPAARRGYDAALKVAPRADTLPARRPALHARAARRHGLPPWLLRHLPQWVLAGTALLALAVVGAVYVSNPRPAAPLAAAPLPDVAGLPAEVPREDPAASAPAAEPVIAKSRVATAVPPPSRAPSQPVVLRSVVVPPAPAAQPVPPPEESAGTTTARTQPAPAQAPLAAAPATPTARPEPPAARPAKPDPNATLARLVATYERGDTPAFMALFDEVAISNPGGKPQIRRAHEALFRSTDLRQIDFEGMAWAEEGDWILGKGRYRTTLMRKGDLRLQTEAGRVRIELLRRGDQALIMGLDYQPGENL